MKNIITSTHSDRKKTPFTVKRILRNRNSGICSNCFHGGRFGCRIAEYRDDPCYSRGFEDYWDLSEIVECERFETKFVLKAGNGSIDKLCNKLFSLGLFVEWYKTGDIESGSYYSFDVYDVESGERVGGGVPYGLEEELRTLYKNTIVERRESKVNKLKADIKAVNDNVVVRINSQKSEFKSCKHCEGKFKKSFVTTEKCPICKTALYTTAENTRVNNLLKRLSKIK